MSTIIKMHYKENDITIKLAEKIREIIYDEDIIIVCIGTDKCIGDCVGPMVGTLLIERGYYSVYGTLDCPIHALNLKDKLHDIKKANKNKTIIAIDSCLGKKTEIGKVLFKEGPVKPGAGVGKTLPSVGNYSINGIVDESSEDDSSSFFSRNIRFSLIYKMANIIADSIILAMD